MASVGLAITILEPESGQTLAQQQLLGPQANATPAQGPNQQHDTVTLAGRTAESQEGRTGNTGTQFGEAAAFFFAESQTFRATNGSGGDQTAKPPDVPQLPVKTTQEPDVGETHGAPKDTEDSTAASALTASNASFSTGSTSPSSDTPLAELAQLDTTLQQMDINPQSISLFSRMAMLLYANDPAALRELVQTLQQGTQEIGVTASDTGSGTPQMTSQSFETASPSGQLSAEMAGSQSLNGSIRGQSQLVLPQLQLASQAQANPVEANAPRSSASAEIQSAAPTGRGGVQTSLSAQFGELRSIFAVIAGTGADMEAEFTPAGQTLDVTA